MAGANQSEPLSFGEAAGGLAEQARPASDWFKKKKEEEEAKEEEEEKEVLGSNFGTTWEALGEPGSPKLPL